MDPASVIGIAGAVVGTINVIARSISFLLNLQTRYKKADLTVSLLIGQLATLKAALNQISELITKSLAAVPRHAQLVADLTLSIEACNLLILELDDRINSFKRNQIDVLNRRGKAQFLWDEEGTKDFLNHLNNQINALNLLLTAFQCRSIFEQRDLLQSRESRHIVNLVEDNMSSLRVLRDIESCHTQKSALTENLETLDAIFDFDSEIFSSKAYLMAMRSNTRQAILRGGKARAQHDRLSSDYVTDIVDVTRSDDNKKDTRTIREATDSRPHVNEPLYQTIIEASQGGSHSDIVAGIFNDTGLDDDGQDAQTIREITNSALAVTEPPYQTVMEESQAELTTLKRLTTRHHDEDLINPVNALLTSQPLKDISGATDFCLPSCAFDGEEKSIKIGKWRAQEKASYLPNWLKARILTPSTAPKRARECQTKPARTGEMENVIKLRQERRERSRNVLILGAAEAGKSTIVKSMKLYCEGSYSQAERMTFVEIIFEKMIRGMRALLDEMDRLGIALGHQSNDRFVQLIYDEFAGPYSHQLCYAIESLWKDFGVQQCFKMSSKYQLNDSNSYFFDSGLRIAEQDFMPTDQDILRSSSKTYERTQTEYLLNNAVYNVWDVGGARSQRNEWIHCFEDVDAVIFVADISEYDQTLWEDDQVYRMQETLTVFDEICNCKWLRGRPVVLIFNKTDCLEHKLTTSPIKPYFQGFLGDPTSVEDVKAFFTFEFLRLNQDASRKIAVHFTSAVHDTNLGESVFAALEKVLVPPDYSDTVEKSVDRLEVKALKVPHPTLEIFVTRTITIT